MSNCEYELIPKNITLACEYVKENCSSSYIDFYSMNYCLLNNRLYLTIPILFIILIISFFLLSDTSNRYLSSALTILSDKLKMSQNLAGVTLLALGNGAPDVISGIVASGDTGGVEFTVGSLFGGGVFITCIVFSSVVLFSNRVQLTKQLFIRDVILYMLALIILIIFSLYGKIGIFQAIGFFSLYIMYDT
jgi:sodium/potassium/calcium exchanger 6